MTLATNNTTPDYQFSQFNTFSVIKKNCILQPNKNENFARGRILIAEKNLAWGDEPYTLQPEGCKKEGDYIHLTPGYLTTDASSNPNFKPGKILYMVKCLDCINLKVFSAFNDCYFIFNRKENSKGIFKDEMGAI